MAKKKAVRTNAMRSLDAKKIPYEVIYYEAEEVGENFGSYIAEVTGLNHDICFKTLVAVGSEPMTVCIPVDCEVDLKKLAKISGNKKAELIHVRELLGLTGYIRGGVSPIGMKKNFPTYIHESCVKCHRIAISAGVCGVTLLISPEDLKNTTNAVICDLIKE